VVDAEPAVLDGAAAFRDRQAGGSSDMRAPFTTGSAHHRAADGSVAPVRITGLYPGVLRSTDPGGGRQRLNQPVTVMLASPLTCPRDLLLGLGALGGQVA
jgi:hypothetical protein